VFNGSQNGPGVDYFCFTSCHSCITRSLESIPALLTLLHSATHGAAPPASTTAGVIKSNDIYRAWGALEVLGGYTETSLHVGTRVNVISGAPVVGSAPLPSATASSPFSHVRDSGTVVAIEGDNVQVRASVVPWSMHRIWPLIS